jgi:polar amino acid transport system permease protein
MDAFLELLPALLRGAKITIELTIMSAVLAFIVAFIAGFGRLSKYKIVRGATLTYVEFFRGTSLLVQLFWLYFALPFWGIILPKMLAAVLAIGLNYAAYGSEVVRSAILAIPKGQTEASIALNMTPLQRMRHVILPQAFVRMLPPFGNLLIELLKGTALVYLITISDVTNEAMTLRNSYISLEPQIFILLLLIYFVIACSFTLGVRWLERRLAKGRS